MSTALDMVSKFETKKQATDRLQKEERWEEFDKQREALRLQLRAEGMGKPEAVAESWRRMVAKFSPLVIRPIEQVEDFVRETVHETIDGWTAEANVTLSPEALEKLRRNLAYMIGYSFEELALDLGPHDWRRLDEEVQEVLSRNIEKIFSVCPRAVKAFPRPQAMDRPSP